MTSFIIGTAGHIDHGKTSLVKALTGIDTDRLKEEKQRGMSIDLGFAHLDLPGGVRAGVVDVPGHERFMRNMLAGAHAVDLVLFAVAADDGVMPQTEEHLQIVHLLGIERAIFVITKADVADEARLQEVTDEILILTDGTAFDISPIVSFSSLTGKGLETLQSKIVEMLARCRPRRTDGYFRMPVDRAFWLQGHGLVVTGTAVSGEVRCREQLRSLPRDAGFRTRTIHVHGREVPVASQGQRVALNVISTEKSTVQRGDVICHEKLSRTTQRFDVFLQACPSTSAGIKSQQRVRTYLGTAERFGKVIVLGSETVVRARHSAYCQIVLAEPVHALRGDRFVVRDDAAQQTLGGGVVVHPWARKHRGADPALQMELRALHLGDVGEAAEAFILGESGFAVPLDDLVQFFNLRDNALKPQLAQVSALSVLLVDGSCFYTTVERLLNVREEVLVRLRSLHLNRPSEAGMDVEALRLTLRRRPPPKLFRFLIQQLRAAGVLEREGHYLRVPGHRVRIDAADRSLAESIMAILSGGPLAPAEMKLLVARTASPRGKLLDLLTAMERQGLVARIGSDLYVGRESLDVMTRRVRDYLARHKLLTPAAFRELFGTSRKYTIPLLEYLDRERITVRIGAGRTLTGHPKT